VTEQELRRTLQQRVKELTCLVTVSGCVQQSGDIEQVSECTAAALVLAMQNPELAAAHVEIDGHKRPQGTPGLNGRSFTAPILVSGQDRGHVAVGYVDDGSAEFLPEELELVQTVAATLALWLAQREATSALAESEGRFRRLIDNLPDVVFRFRLGKNPGLDYVSPAAKGLTGFSATELMEDAAVLERLIGAARLKKADATANVATSSTASVVQVIGRGGSIGWTEYNLVPVYDEHGNITAVEGVARDVTERVTAAGAVEQRALEQAALARVGQAALTADVLSDLFDMVTKVITETLKVDAAGLYELLPENGDLVLSSGAGWPDGVVGQTRLPVAAGSLAALALAQDAPLAIVDIRVSEGRAAPFLAANGIVGALTVVIGGKDAPFGVLAAYTLAPREFPSSQVQFLQTLAHMIGAVINRTCAETAVRESELEFRTLAENLPDIVARFDREHRHLYINPRVKASLGLSPGDLIGRTNRELGMAAPLVDAWEEAADRVFHSGQPATVEGVYRRAEGASHLQSLLIPEFDAAGKVRTVVGVTRDITELRRGEEERREVFARIVAAQEEERARIGEDIHDDSIQVMTAVGMRLEGLRRRVGNADAVRSLERLEETVRRSISRLRLLMFELRPPELDRDGLAATLRLYLETTATDGLPIWELNNYCAEELPTDMRVVLYRIALEAITNVRKHASASRLEIILTEEDDGVRLQVRDDGSGFDPAMLDGFRPHHLGTTTMRQRAEAAGGHMAIETAAGRGTDVTVWLPRPPTPSQQ
jgi:PAS domain S-box-containing protein